MNDYYLRQTRVGMKDCSVDGKYSRRVWTDPLCINVYYLSGDKSWCLVIIDTTELSTYETSALRRRVAEMLGIDYQAVWVGFTHTHAAWAGYSTLDMDKLSDSVLQAVAAVKEAPAQVVDGVALLTVDTGDRYAVNRRAYVPGVGSFSVFQCCDCHDDGEKVDATDWVRERLRQCCVPESDLADVPRTTLNGPVDGNLQLLLFGCRGSAVAGVVRFNAHPVIVSSEYYRPHFSRDYCGVLCDTLAQAWRCPMVFMQGAAGNQRSRHTINTPQHCQAFGQALAGELDPRRFKPTFSPLDSLAVASKTVPCRLHDYVRWPKEQRRQRVIEIEKQMETCRADGERVRTLKVLSDEKLALQSVDNPNIGELGYVSEKDLQRGYCDVDVVAARFGSIVLVGAGNELANFFSLDLYGRFGTDQVMVAAFTNGCNGYVLEPWDFERGGYEQSASVVVPESAGMMLSAAHELVAELTGRTVPPSSQSTRQGARRVP